MISIPMEGSMTDRPYEIPKLPVDWDSIRYDVWELLSTNYTLEC